MAQPTHRRRRRLHGFVTRACDGEENGKSADVIQRELHLKFLVEVKGADGTRASAFASLSRRRRKGFHDGLTRLARRLVRRTTGGDGLANRRAQSRELLGRRAPSEQ